MYTLQLGGMIREGSVSYHFFADDSQVHDSTEHIHVPCPVKEITPYIDKVSDWMIAS